MKKFLALLMAFALVLSLGVSAFAADTESDDADHVTSSDHGTDEGAVIASENAGNGFNSDNNTGKTDFYITVDKYATDGGKTAEDEEIAVAGDVLYMVDYDRSSSYNIKATVPLYVCMYAYGGDGHVVVPDEDSYKIDNESTGSNSTNLKSVTKYYKMVDSLLDLIAAEDTLTEEEILAGEGSTTLVHITFTNQAGTTTSRKTVKLGDLYNLYKTPNCLGYYINVDAEDADDIEIKPALVDTYIFNYEGQDYYWDSKDDDGELYFYYDGEEYDDLEVDDPVPWEENAKGGIALEMFSIKADAADWSIRPVGEMAQLVKEEFVMTINSVDLSLASGDDAYTLTGRQLWVIPAPTTTVNSSGVIEVTNTTPLELPITAAIAGNSVNDDTHAQVVSVTYYFVANGEIVD